MFEVLVFVYENYYAGENCPEPASLERKLSSVGFETDEISDAMRWLGGLNSAARSSHGFAGAHSSAVPEPWFLQPQATSMRGYSSFEQRQLGPLCLGYLIFLESADMLAAPMREVIIDRAMAVPAGGISLDDFKTIILMVFWSFGTEPNELLLDELCDDGEPRVAH